MEPKKVQEKNGKVFETTGVTVEPGYLLHPSYDMAILGPTRIGETGYLKVIEWRPKDPGLYYFFGRWDERQGFLDIDMGEIVGGKLRLLDIDEWPLGYLGHHPVRMPGGSRRFEVKIQMPTQGGKSNVTVFHGVVDFGVVRELGLKDGLAPSDDFRCEADVSRPQAPESKDDKGEPTAPA